MARGGMIYLIPPGLNYLPTVCLHKFAGGGGEECCLKILHGVEGPLIKIAKGVPFSKNYFSKNGEKMGEKFRTNNKQRFRSNRDINLI